MTSRCFTSFAFLAIALLTIAALGGCRQETAFRTPSGLVYQVIGGGTGDSFARMGNTVKLHFIQKAGDSIVDNNYDKMPFYWTVMPGFNNRYNPLEVFDYKVYEGDSLVITQRLDSMVKKRVLDSMPSYLTASDNWITYMKVEKILRSDSAVQMDKLREQKKVDSFQKTAGDERVRKYLSDRQITAIKQPNGIYLQNITPGQGPAVDSGKKIGVKYVFLNMTNGKIFDANTDPSFHHHDTMFFKVGGPFMIRSVDQTMRQLRLGSHAKMFVPTMSAFGGRPPHGNLHPYDDLSFEVWVLSVD